MVFLKDDGLVGRGLKSLFRAGSENRIADLAYKQLVTYQRLYTNGYIHSFTTNQTICKCRITNRTKLVEELDELKYEGPVLRKAGVKMIYNFYN